MPLLLGKGIGVLRSFDPKYLAEVLFSGMA
jgi:hypothetical protein